MSDIPRRFSPWAVALSVALVSGVAGAQDTYGAPPSANATRADTPASAPAAGEAPGKPKGRGSAAWWGSDVTPGWKLMTWAERNAHRKSMRAMKTYEECKAYLEQHHEQMAARAKERGQEPLKPAPRDACEKLKS